MASQYRARAERGDADAQYHLGWANYYGSGVPQDYAEAIRWFRKSAEQGTAKAQYALGYSYFYGRGVPQDLAESTRWDRKAADQGYPQAECQLASLYYEGQAVPQDLAESIRWYRKCANHGDVTGQRSLGYLYDHGEGVPRDSVEAARWYRKAAEQGDLAAEVCLAAAYRKGQGVPQSYIQATRWYLAIAASTAPRCARRMGWIPFVALFVLIGVILVPERLWGRFLWMSWALMSIACAAYAFHLVSREVCSGWWRVFGIGALGVLSALSASCAVYGAIHPRKRGVDPGQHSEAPRESPG